MLMNVHVPYRRCPPMSPIEPYTVPLTAALDHLVHVVRYVDPDGIRVAVQRVLAAGGSLDVRVDDDRTPVTWLACGGHTACLRLLLTAGASPDVPMARGNTALHRAVNDDRPDVVAVLLEHGADPNRRNDQRISPRDLAHGPVIRAMLERAILQRELPVPTGLGDDPVHRRL